MTSFGRKSNLLLRRTVGYIVISAICLGLSAALFEFYLLYQQELQRIYDDLDAIEQTQVETLVNNAWLLNSAGIQTQLQSLVQHPDIVYLEFSDTQDREKITAGEKPASLGGIISRAVPLYFEDKGEKTFLGNFQLLVSTEPTKTRLYQRIPLLALSESIKIFLICLLVIGIIYSLFSRHLSRIAQFTNTLDIDTLQERLTLKRKENPEGKTDELSQIVQAVNDLLDRIQEGLLQKEQVEIALRKNEELLQFATEGASLGIWDWNMVTDETYFNPTYCTMLGFEVDAFPHTFETWSDLMHPDDREKVVAEVTRCVAEDQLWRVEFRMRTQKGGYKWILGSGKVVEKDVAGHPIRASGIHLDISESKSLEEERQKVMRLESVGVLAGGIAHDFNNILAAILGNVELAAHRVSEDEKTLSLLSSAQKATKRAARLTQQLLTFSKGGEPVRETTLLAELVWESADFVLHGSQVSCEYSFPEDLWPVDADSGQLGQVIQNITLNAIHSMPEGGTLEIHCRNVESGASETLWSATGGPFVCISIRDTGSGIPVEIRGKIFDPYYTTKSEGSGLGLSVCHSIISKHGGHIAVESVLGQGTTFLIYVPAVSALDTSIEKKQPLRAAARSVTVMLMDDDEMVRNVGQAQLSTLGHTTITVMDGEQAIARYQELQAQGTPVDLVIMDLTIPGGMGGQEAARELLQIVPEAKIIVSSGYSNDPVMANYREYGFCGALTKPFDLDALKKGIEAALVQGGVQE